MKQYYESEVLFQLMERDGLNIPSSVPPYESEIKAYLINQVKQAYPKLTDYEAEWLLYNYTKHLPADFPISSATDVTEATFENVVPYAYQNAILKGQTLVNLFENPIGYEYVTINKASTRQINLGKADMLKPNTSYTFVYSLKGVKGTIPPVLNLMSSKAQPELRLNIMNGTIKQTFTTPTDYNGSNQTIRLYYQMNIDDNENSSSIAQTILLEGDYSNIDISYFEGMQSVKKPVLTFTNGNLLNLSPTALEMGSISGITGALIQNNTRCHTTKIKVSQKVDLFLKRINCNYQVAVRYYYGDTLVNTRLNNNGGFIDDGNLKVNGGEEYDSIKLIFAKSDNSPLTFEEVAKQQIMLVPNNNYTTYEPYKPNILTTSEEVELRGTGDVQDTLDLLTGEVVERVGTKKLKDITFSFRDDLESETTYLISFGDASHYIGGDVGSKILSNITTTSDIYYVCETEGIRYDGWGLYLRIKKDRITKKTYDAVKQYFESTDATIQYQNKTESIKTVELTTVNENGESVHFMPLEGTMNVQSLGEIIPPTFDMSVPVEATTQNLASFIDLQMEE